MPRYKEVYEFLDRMDDQYKPTESFHKQVGSMLEKVCADDFPQDKVGQILEQAEHCYQNHARHIEIRNQTEEIQRKIAEEPDVKKKAEYYLLLHLKMGEALDGVVDSMLTVNNYLSRACGKPSD